MWLDPCDKPVIMAEEMEGWLVHGKVSPHTVLYTCILIIFLKLQFALKIGLRVTLLVLFFNHKNGVMLFGKFPKLLKHVVFQL